MKIDRSVLISFLLLIVIASLYRIMPERPLGFAPQIAMALFGGSVIKDRKMSFLLPLLSMLFSDIMYEILYQNGLTTISGFYSGQVLNYILFAGITVIGFGIKKDNLLHIFAGSLIGATAFFLLSNFGVWIGGGLDINNIPYPKTMAGLTNCFTQALPFYKGALLSTVFFSGILFGGYYLANKFWAKPATVIS
ncbi:hypothetical protein LK994_13995 [Ferruginibacter lapsinanis]|uniref:DUF6580 family putative transport protein n=1 Tax=Ferruginibacter lapsinanis TaxID=563172 RepID=UPI001E4C2F79|nr:DUF6580 family putative transport protein [Ferruginibacter lapsinanis]UEG49749.1 hypothetical protein LK994_13995 [Ferruginibacter lapsinanis]